MNKFWNFPAATGGMINSINNAGMETFRGNALDALTREICQNSLDAIKNQEEPVVVEFSSFSADMDIFPNRREMLEIFKQCEDTWKDRNQKSEDFIKDALEILDREKINVLRISDFNTKGLEGAEDGELGSPWSSLVKEAGSSNKGESSGGSFGIGKSAPFLNSKLRTLFYSSVDITGYESHIGVANIMSFRKDNDQITLGNGYYTNNDKSKAIPGQLSLEEQFVREETGTDIYVMAFEPGRQWESEVIKSILFNFFITVYNQKLIVRINDFEINKSNIQELIYDLEDNEENRILKNYFNLLISEKTIKIEYPAKKYKAGIHFEEGEATLFLLNGEDLNRRVLMTRKTGMRLFEQKNISGSISFTGLLMITGNQMNNIFKQMENPAHNEWSPDRYEKNPKLANAIYSDLRKFMRQSVKEYFQEQVTDSMDAVGLSDFLPNKNMISDTGANKTESLNSKIKSLVTKEKKEEPKRKTSRRRNSTEEQDFEEQLSGEYGITSTGEEGGNGDGSHGEGGNAGGGSTNPGGQNELNPDRDGDSDKKKERKPNKNPISIEQKYVPTERKNGKYKFFISSKKPMERGKLVFKVIGEQSDYDLPIKTASTDDQGVVVEKVESNAVYIGSVPAHAGFKVDVEIDYYDYCVMEVELYED
ncbi:hypothetical protein LCM10_04825 [Rossellomorea aquimaris]|uniref:hypothetical protein n=1 Tax=Rossellomorea aquimaris TaxID=189382 RepID=UPI001CD60B10|nr:hypothetical protein [Rossellomorea aquimaris]MCA1054303.1 hypothetical protein [Rossellomorea aquimaris]